MLATRESPAALVVLIYMRPSEDESQLLGYDCHFLALWDHTWHWIAHDYKEEILYSSSSLRDTAAVLARQALPFDYAHMIVITGTEGYEEESPWEIFPIEQVLEEVGSLFEKTPKFLMEFGTRTFSVIPVTTWSPRHFVTGEDVAQTHLLYIPQGIGEFAEHLAFVNMKMNDGNLDSDRWDKVEVGLLCGNELVVVQTYRGTAQIYSDTREPADVHRSELISLDDARRFVEAVATSIECNDGVFVDVWGRATLTPLGEQILASTSQDFQLH